jgi:sirohydrochlorin ferrochelatase
MKQPSAAFGMSKLPSSFATAAIPRATRLSCSTVAASAENDPATVGVVIVDHGSKKKTSNDMLLEFVDVYKKTTGRSNVQPAHMEIAEPSISQAIAACVSQGARTVIIAPYFLSKGRHIQEDIPALVQEAQEQHPHVECLIAAPIGVDPLMAQLIESRVAQAVQ